MCTDLPNKRVEFNRVGGSLHCNRHMGTDLLLIFSPHYSDMLFMCFLTKT